MQRRTFIQKSSLVSLGLLGAPAILTAKTRPEVQRITQGPQQHWFGYYDKLQIDPTGRYALANEVELFFRSPKPEDKLKIGLIDLENNNLWREIGQSTAWGWQQGCMLQWLPGDGQKIIWNARAGDQFVSTIYDLATNRDQVLPHPIYTLSPDGRYGFGLDFARLQFFRPGYGYASSLSGTPAKAPEDTGIYRVDLQNGKKELILSYAQIAQVERPLGSVKDNFHWVNHLLVNPSGNRLFFLNRSRPYTTAKEYREKIEKSLRGDEPYVTRAITANLDGSDLYALNDSGTFSHFIWKGDNALCAWAKPEDKDVAAFYLFQDKTKAYEVVGEEIMTRNGHNTYVPHTNNEWILNDTYPQGEKRLQELYLYHEPTRRKVTLGKFHEPSIFKGEWRCDLHPRCDQAGKRVFFDSTHEGLGRQLYAVSIEELLF